MDEEKEEWDKRFEEKGLELMEKEKPKNNIEKLIGTYKEWVKRFEEKGLEWDEQDWVNWGIDITDGITELFVVIRSLGLLYKGAGDLLYEDLKEEPPTNTNKVEDIKGFYL